LFSLICANYSTPLYYISDFLTSPLGKLNINQTRFVTGYLFPYLSYVMDNKQGGLLVPRHLCESVLLKQEDGDELFNNWFSKMSRNGKPITEDGDPLNYTQDAPIINKDGATTYQYTLSPSDSYNVYPSPGDMLGWSGLILEWLGPKGQWCFKENADRLLVPHPVDPDMKDPFQYWFMNGSGRGDNFLARMGILPTAPIIVYFCNNKYSVNGMPVDAQALQNLFAPSGPNAGGWIGFLNGANNEELDWYLNYIKTGVDDPPVPTPPVCKPTNVGKGFLSGLSSFFGMLGFAAATGGTGGIAIAIAGAAGGAINGYQAAQGTC
jgi:hypothetical protein